MKYLIMLHLLLSSIALSEPLKQSYYKQHGKTKIFYSALIALLLHLRLRLLMTLSVEKIRDW